METKKTVTAKIYNLRTEQGDWLGQVVLTSDGMFASVTDWGNFSYIWRSFSGTFEDFILSLNDSYFSQKMMMSISEISFSKETEKRCEMFAKRILPALQKEIKKPF